MSVLRSTTTWLLMGALAACGNDGPTDPDDDDDDDGIARVTLTIAGLVGTEKDMAVRFVIADGPTSRATASVPPLPFGCFSVVDPVCPIDVPVGKTLSLFAIEGEGYVAGDAGNGRPVPPPDPLHHEFVRFVGDCATNAVLGDCVLHVTQDRNYAIRADFAQMQKVIFGIEGAGALKYSFTARDRIAMPNSPYQNTNPGCCAGSGVSVPAAPVVYGYLPTGSTVTATRQTVGNGLSQFIQWDKACTAGGGIEPSCTQIVGPTPTPFAIAKFEYYDCGPQGLTDGGTGETPPPGCTKIRPP